MRPPRSSAALALAERLTVILGGDDANVAAFEAAIARGPDPVGATLRAETLRDEALAALASPHAAPLRRLLHQGSYPARLLNAWPPAIEALCGPSPRLRDAAPAAVERPPTRDELVAELEHAVTTKRPADAIAQVRTREYLRIAALEIADAPLEAVGGALSDLAAACTQAALLAVDPKLAEDLVVFGMGKLGGDELNFLSDIDLLFAHRDELIPAGADGFRPRARLFDALRKVVKLLEGEGVWRPLFRVDLRLRPFGTRGPLSLSQTALLDYYERHGRAWERQMWLRAQPIAGNLALGRQILEQLDPFVYRRTLSPAVFAEIEDMMSRARRETARGLHDGGTDLKYGPGGIRDVEFFVQGLQLLNGGKNRAVRATDTLGGLDRLLAQGLLADREHAALTAAYRWLRRTEHRVQLVEGQQTHAVPGPLDARRALAIRLASPSGAVSEPEADVLLASFDTALADHLGRVRNIVATLSRADGDGPDAEASGFFDVVDAPQRAAAKVVLDPTSPRPALERAFATLELFDPSEAAGMLQALRGDARSAFASTDESLRGANRLLMACLDAPDPDAALRRLSEFSSRRPAHYAAWRFLAAPANDAIVRLVAELFASSESLSRGLVGFPGPHGRAGDEALSMLVDARQSRLPDAASLSALTAALTVAGTRGEELDRALLVLKHRELTRIALHDLARRPGPARIGAAISALATATLRALAADLAREYAETSEHQPAPPSFRLCVIGLGKFGMESMDYGSDLDVVFVFDPIDEPAVAVQSDAVRVTRALQRRLEDRRLGARLFEVDTRLRPSGRQGLLVSSLESFRRYHDGSLPTWERLAALRMRPVVEMVFGPAAAQHEDTPISDEIEREIRVRSVWPDHDAAYAEIAADVRALKSRIEAELSRETRRSTDPVGRDARYNAKSGIGGSLELELLVSALQLRAGRTDPSNDAVRGRDIWRALDALHAAGWLDETEHASLVEAYGFLRRMLNRLRMTSTAGGEDPDLFAGNSPRLAPLARRMGFEDVDVLLTRFLEHRSAVRAAFDRHLS